MRILTILLGALLTLGGCGDGDTTTASAPREVDQLAYGVSQIFIAIDKNRPASQAEPLIRQAARALAQGESFEDVARGRSAHGSSVDGGFLGFVRTDVETAFGGAVQAMRPGQVSPPIRTKQGWHIIKRHSFDDGRKLEQRYRIPTHGVFVTWDDPTRPSPRAAGRTKEQAYAAAIELRDKLASGAITLDLAMEVYTPPERRAPEAFIGPTANRGQNGEIFAALQASKPGALLGPFDTPEGFAVLVRGRYLRSLFRHILIQHTASEERDLSVSRTPQQAAELAQKILERVLADRSAWDAQAEAHSDDKWSRTTRGRMGVLHPGGLPPGFSAFAYEQKPDTIHPKVVQTPFGFHVVWKVN
ncbi:MAG: peptidylprolyl isomerase [Planctomycetota bacterium]|nr:peptidylprolyl isomerase [Planctomycetota bacterium]